MNQVLAQHIHIYDHASSRLFVENGSTIHLRNNPFDNADDAVEWLIGWARKQKLIGEQDSVVYFEPVITVVERITDGQSQLL